MLKYKDFFKKRPFAVFLAASTVLHLSLLALPMTGSSLRTPPPVVFEVSLAPPPDLESLRDAFSAVKPAHKKSRSTRSEHPKTSPPPPQHKQARLPEPTLQDEATVSLNSYSKKQARFSSYLDHLRSKINSVWQSKEYPISAKKKGLGGQLTLHFSLSRSGQLTGLQLTDSSGHAVLDREALRTIRQAAPFSRFPDSFSISRLNVLASFNYRFSH